MMRTISALIILLLLIPACETEYAGQETRRINELDETANPEIAIARDMLAAALIYDINRFVERNRPKLDVCFLSILDVDPADELLARLKDARLEVHKFSEWATYSKDEDGQSVMPERFFRISVRDVRIMDATRAEVDTHWSASGVYLPGETFSLEKIAESWRVTGVRYTSR